MICVLKLCGRFLGRKIRDKSLVGDREKKKKKRKKKILNPVRTQDRRLNALLIFEAV